MHDNNPNPNQNQKQMQMQIEKSGYGSLVHGAITGILLPIVGYLVTEINTTKKDLADYKVIVAQELGQKVYRADLDRLETKIDNLRNLFIEMVKEHHK